MRYLLCLLLSCLFFTSASAAPVFSLDRPETLFYDIAFLWFKNFGEGRLEFVPGATPGTFQATAHARTLGVAAWASRNREQTYHVDMRLDEEGWLRPIRTSSTMVRGEAEQRDVRVSEYFYDYAAGQVLYRKSRQGKQAGEKLLPLPAEERLFDLLSAFYNWRLGKFGELEPGSQFRLPAFSRDGRTEILVTVRTREEQRERTEYPAHGLLCRVVTDKEVFNTGGGEMYVWINDATEPGIVQVQDVLNLGDVWATLRK